MVWWQYIGPAKWRWFEGDKKLWYRKSCHKGIRAQIQSPKQSSISYRTQKCPANLLLMLGRKKLLAFLAKYKLSLLEECFWDKAIEEERKVIPACIDRYWGLHCAIVLRWQQIGPWRRWQSPPVGKRPFWARQKAAGLIPQEGSLWGRAQLRLMLGVGNLFGDPVTSAKTQSLRTFDIICQSRVYGTEFSFWSYFCAAICLKWRIGFL